MDKFFPIPGGRTIIHRDIERKMFPVIGLLLFPGLWICFPVIYTASHALTICLSNSLKFSIDFVFSRGILMNICLLLRFPFGSCVKILSDGSNAACRFGVLVCSSMRAGQTQSSVLIAHPKGTESCTKRLKAICFKISIYC